MAINFHLAGRWPAPRARTPSNFWMAAKGKTAKTFPTLLLLCSSGSVVLNKKSSHPSTSSSACGGTVIRNGIPATASTAAASNRHFRQAKEVKSKAIAKTTAAEFSSHGKRRSSEIFRDVLNCQHFAETKYWTKLLSFPPNARVRVSPYQCTK